MNPELPLRDIHLPEAITWWPPAPGWWISAVLAIAIIVLVTRWLRHRVKRLAPYKSAQLELQQIKSHYKNGQDQTGKHDDCTARGSGGSNRR
jgi:hypothetical protein